MDTCRPRQHKRSLRPDAAVSQRMLVETACAACGQVQSAKSFNQLLETAEGDRAADALARENSKAAKQSNVADQIRRAASLTSAWELALEAFGQELRALQRNVRSELGVEPRVSEFRIHSLSVSASFPNLLRPPRK